MRDCVKDAFLEYTRTFESLCLFLYLDILGLVTTGYGNLVDPHLPAQLDFRGQDGNPVTQAEVRAEWDKIKGLQRLKTMGGGVFRHYTRLRITQASIDAYASRVRDDMWKSLLYEFPDAGEWPADAQLGAMSIAWACGQNCWHKWPNFSIAAFAQNWTVCAEESHIDDSHNPGVTRRNAAQRTLFLNAAQTCSPELLTYKV